MIGMEGGQMSGAGPRGGVDPDFDVVAYRVRIAKLTDAQLIEEGKYYRQVVGYRLQPYNPRFQAMLDECIAEWRRRYPRSQKSDRQESEPRRQRRAIP
jgi:hypothetical protein